MPVVEVNNLVKHYRDVEALRGVSLSVEKGEIFGLLGPNGAGKTTMVKILLGITQATSGEARLLNQPTGAIAVRKKVGYLPEDHRFPEYHTPISLLRFYGKLLDVPAEGEAERINKNLELVGLRKRQNSKIRTFSKGMKQRVGIAQALFHDPEVLFLDEPTDGVDPVGRKKIRGILAELKAAGVTVFVNSHLLGEVELICDHVAIVNNGVILEYGPIPNLIQPVGNFEIGLAPDEEPPLDELERMGYQVIPMQANRWLLEGAVDQPIDPVVELIHSRGLHLRHLTQKRETLEDAFLRVIEGDTAQKGAEIASGLTADSPSSPESTSEGIQK